MVLTTATGVFPETALQGSQCGNSGQNATMLLHGAGPELRHVLDAVDDDWTATGSAIPILTGL